MAVAEFEPMNSQAMTVSTPSQLWPRMKLRLPCCREIELLFAECKNDLPKVSCFPGRVKYLGFFCNPSITKHEVEVGEVGQW